MMNRAVFKPKNSNDVHWSALRVNGVDARDFLHRITTVNLHELQAGQESEGFLLSPQGKIQAYFYLSCLSDSEFILEFDAGSDGFWKKNLREKLEFYHFGEKMKIEDLHGNFLWKLGSGWDSGLGENGVSVFGDGWMARHADSKFGLPWVTIFSPGKMMMTEAEEVSWSDLDALRIEHGTAWWGIEIQPESNPLDLGLGGAIADQKGCYPGQEVIEKIIAIGSPAKKLCTVKLSSGEERLLVVGKANAAAGKTFQDQSLGQILVVKVWIE